MTQPDVAPTVIIADSSSLRGDVYRLASIRAFILEAVVAILIFVVFSTASIVAATERYLAGVAFALVVALLPALSIWLRSQLSNEVRVQADGAFIFVRPIRRATAVWASETLSVSLGSSALGRPAEDAGHIRIEHTHGVERLPLNATSQRVVAALQSRNVRLRLEDSYLSTVRRDGPAEERELPSGDLAADRDRGGPREVLGVDTTL